MERISVDEVDPAGTTVDRRRLSDPLGTTNVAINRYRVPSGERVSGLHAHADQEEVFVVLEGTATFETLEGEVPVDAGQAVRFAPGEYQSCTNADEDDLVVLALGAPRDGGEVLIPLACPECGHDDRRVSFSDDGEVLVCPECNAESVAECPECGGDDLRAVLGDGGEPVSVCLDCGVESKG